ncbi:MAG: class I SAM-dependent methyltransferase [Caldilineae bacterium]|nr:MAG: class I SAM-dependent methyltransferase [Caldilineae bacterium]
MNEKRFHGSPDFLRNPERLARLEVDRVVTLALEGLPVRRVLDVGTGSGVFAEAFARHGLKVVGVDISEEMLAAARRLVPGVDFQQAAMEDLPFPDASFDLVFLGHALHETDDLPGTLAKLARCARQRVAALEWPYRDEPMGPPLAHRLRPEQVTAAAEGLGFARIETLPLSQMVLYRLTKEVDT